MSKMLKLSLVTALIFVLGVPLAFAKSTERRSKPIPVSTVVPVADMEAEPPRVVTGTTYVTGVNYQTTCEDIDPQGGTIIQHDQIGSTYYDYQSSGSMGRMIAVGPGGYRHMVFHETRGPYDNTTYPRYVTYNCEDPANNWLGPMWIDGGVNRNAGYANIAVTHTGGEVAVYHRATAGGCYWWSCLIAGDAGYVCQGHFSNIYDLPDHIEGTVDANRGMWPKHTILYDAAKDTDFIHIVVMEMTSGAGADLSLGYQRCKFVDNNLLCLTRVGGSLVSYTRLPNQNYPSSLDKIGVFDTVKCLAAVVVSSPVSRRVAIVYTKNRQDNQVNNDVMYIESMNNGDDWLNGTQWPPIKHNITNYPTGAMERAYTDVAACYDYNDSLHIVWNTAWYDSVQSVFSKDANLYHWNKTTGISMIASAYWGGTEPGAWNLNISKMSISAMDPSYHPGGNPDSVYLYCIWTQFDSADNAANGYTNGDIYGAGSRDGGATWGFARNLTNTKTPGCAAGECLSEHWSSLAQNLYNGNLHIQYVCDRDAGGAVQMPNEGTWTDNPVMYLEVPAWNPLDTPLIANFSAEPDSGFRPLSVLFTDLSVGNPTSWFWDFGDGSTDTGQNPVHIYSDTGLFDVKLIIADSLCSDTIIKSDYIAIFDTLTVDFTAQPTHGRKPLTVSFHSLCSAIPQKVTWYFGDGDSNLNLNPVHQYTDPGNYDVKLVAEFFSCKDSLTKEDYIQVSDIKAGFGADKRCGSAPLTVNFTDSSTGSYPIIRWHWDFGDGDTSNQQNPVHQFTSTGVFDIMLIVSDSMGADTLTKQDYITTQDSVSADFIGLPNSGRSPLTVMFEPILSGIANHYLWDFGDGDTSTLRNPIHIYTTQGKYDVKLKVRLELDDCNQVDSMIKEEYIIVNDLQAQFSANPTAGVAPLSVQFTDESSGNPNVWFWNFGDGNTSTQQNPQHQYNTAGVFDVFLRLSNLIGSDSLLKLSYVRVDTPYADLYAEIYGPWGPRPGFVLDYYFVWTNLGTIPAEDCMLKMLLPSQMIFEELYDTSGAPFGLYGFSGDTIIASLGTIVPSDWYGGYVYAHGHLPASVPIGDILVCKMWLTSTTPDRNYDNNHDSLSQAVIGSWDPNDKLAYPVGEGVSHSIKPDQRLTYMIEFENKREATAEAIYVRVVDTLDQNLNWGSLAIGASSHPDKCHYEFDPYTGVIVWSCDSIMLPPNQNPPEGEGYFTFSISPKPHLPEGTEISNKAWIRFDYNPWLQAPEEGLVIRTIKYPFIRGDANADGVVDISDVVYLINYLFVHGPAPVPTLDAGDANCDRVVDASDLVYLLNYLFAHGPAPSC